MSVTIRVPKNSHAIPTKNGKNLYMRYNNTMKNVLIVHIRKICNLYVKEVGNKRRHVKALTQHATYNVQIY